MKKTIISLFVLLFTAAFHYSHAKSTSDTAVKNEPACISTLIINADVTVVLVSTYGARLDVTGSESFTKQIALKQTGDTLVINAVKKKDFKNAGVIYVPANDLHRVQVNGEANLRSFYFLRVPKLDVVINGLCQLAISSIGKLNFIVSDDYTFDKTTEVRRLPPGFYAGKLY